MSFGADVRVKMWNLFFFKKIKIDTNMLQTNKSLFSRYEILADGRHC